MCNSSFQDVSQRFRTVQEVSQKNMKEFEKILRLPEVLTMTGLSKTTVWRLQNRGEFPLSKKISDRTIGFLRSEIENWMSNQK